MALLALASLTEAATPAEGGRSLVTVGQIRDACAGLCEQYPAAWAKEEAANLDRLAARVTGMLEQVGLARSVAGGGVLLSPAASRWRPHAEARKASAEPSARAGSEFTLFGDDDGNGAL